MTDGEALIVRAMIFGTGLRYGRLPISVLERFEGVSVHYAATQVEGQRCRGDWAVLVGAGMSAGHAALLLARYLHRLTLVIREDDRGGRAVLADRRRSGHGVVARRLGAG